MINIIVILINFSVCPLECQGGRTDEKISEKSKSHS